MKKIKFSVFAMMIMALVSVGFASCSGDDDDDNGGGRDSALIGIWHCSVYESRSSYTIGWKFDANGNCYYDEWGNSRSEGEWEDPAKWSTSNNILTISWTDEEGTDTETYSYSLSNNNSTLTLTHTNSKNGTTRVFTKQ